MWAQKSDDANYRTVSQVGFGSGRAETIAGKYREVEAQLGDEAEIGEGNGESQREIHEDG